MIIQIREIILIIDDYFITMVYFRWGVVDGNLSAVHAVFVQSGVFWKWNTHWVLLVVSH